MAEGFNFEDINRQFNELSDSLDAIKTQNALNIGDTSRILNNLGAKLDALSGMNDFSQTLDLLEDLKKSFEDRTSYINVKFTEIETTFRNVIKNNEDLVTTPQLKDLFDVLSTNLTVFSKQVMSQGDILNEITLRIEALRTDDTDKREIIKNIGLIRGDLEKFNNGFESIILNVNNNFETVMQNISKLDPTREVESMQTAVKDVKNTSDAIISAVQIVDQKQNSLNSAIEEVVSQNTKINANIKALAGQSDFDGLVRKVESAIELITTLKGALTDASEQSQKSLLLQLDKLSGTVTRILTEEDFEVFKSELSKLVYEVIESTNVMRGDLLSTTSEFKSLANLIEDLDLKNSFEDLKTLVDNTGREVKAGFVDAIANSGIEQIKNNLNLLVERIDQTKDSINENADRTSARTSEKVDSLMTLVDKVREIVTYMPDTIKQNYMSVEEGQRAFVEKSIKDLANISDNIKYLKEDLNGVAGPIRENLLGDVKQLKEIVFDIKNYVLHTDELVSKVDNIELLMGRIAGDYDVALHTVQDSLMQYLSSIKEDCESADIKMNNFAFEFNSLKSELSKVVEDFKGSSKGQNEKFNNVCNGISSRIDTVLSALATISEQPAAISGIKSGFDNVQQTMQDLLLAVSDIKVLVSSNKNTATEQTIVSADSAPISDEFLKLEVKLNKIKDQVSFMSTDFMENLYSRSEVLIKEFEPVQKAVMSFVDVDFQNVASVLKDQMDAYKIGMEKLMEEAPTDDARSVLNSLFTGLGSLENKISNFETSVKNSQLKAVEDIKFMLEQTKPFIPSAAEINSPSVGNAIDISESVDKLTEVLDEKILEIKSDLSDRFENLHKHIDEAVIPRFSAVDNKQNEILAKLDTVKSVDELNSIKNSLNELFDKLSSVQDDIVNNKIQFNNISQERIEGLGEEEKSIIVDFTNNLSELANLVKHSTDNLDTKISRALSENQVNVDFETLKSDIAEMLKTASLSVSNLTVKDNDGEPISNVQILLEEYKAQIVNEIEIVKKAIWDFNNNGEMAKDIKVLSQKMDLIALNDDVKFEIDKSLAEIRNTVKDQQKFLNTINILETLASLEDINKMKGLEQLSKLNELISVDKLNALNKLTLLDKLRNLDCLDELQKIPKITGMIEIQEQLKNIVSGLDNKINAFSKNYSNLDLISEELKNEVVSAKTSIMKHVLNVFEQLSFVVEGEEIKDFVAEQAQLILDAIATNEAVSQEIKTIKHAVDSLKPLEYKDVENDFRQIENNFKQVDEVSQSLNQVIEKLPQELDERFNSFKQQLNLMRVGSTEDDENYNYALQDVESDIARLRLALEDIKKVVETNSLKEIADYVNEIVKQVDSMKFNISQDDIFKMKIDIEKMTSDIVSISSRTNKLLLANDESAQALDMTMKSFKNSMSEIYEGLKKLDYSEISNKLEEISGKVNDNKQQNENITETVAKLSIWADNTEDTLADVSENLNKLKKTMPSNEAILDELEIRFAKQQQKIDALEDKIEELLAISEDRDSSVMSKKLNDIDKQLSRLNKSIERLTSYVDEE